MKLGCVNAVRRKDVKQMEHTKCQLASRAAGSSVCVCVWPDAGDSVITCSVTWGSNSPATGSVVVIISWQNIFHRLDSS